MKNWLVAVLLLMTGGAVAQHAPSKSPFNDSSNSDVTVTEKLYSVSRSDVYCGGFITKQKISKDSFVSGGSNSPYATRFADRDFLFLKGTYEPGARVSIVREISNPDKGEVYAGTTKMLTETGQPYADIGYARVLELRSGYAVAQVEFACESIVPGDIAIPFVERPAVVARTQSTLERFPGEKPALAGKIVMVRDFDQYATAGKKVFLNIGWEKGVKCGDYFRVTRSYSHKDTDIADAGSFSSVLVEDTAKNPPKLSDSRFKDFPRRLVGELIVLNVTPTSATAMVTFNLEEMHAGDMVEIEGPQPQPATTAGSN